MKFTPSPVNAGLLIGSTTMNFEDLQGKTFSLIENMVEGNDEITFTCTDGTKYKLYHDQCCCESVNIVDIDGDAEDLLHSTITLAEVSISSEQQPQQQASDSFTWTFYRIATQRGFLVLRWLGQSNGYYGEEVDFRQVV